jgi:hypothetical protein
MSKKPSRSKGMTSCVIRPMRSAWCSVTCVTSPVRPKPPIVRLKSSPGPAQIVAARRADELEGADMAAESAGAVMVLAMNVVGERATDGDEGRAGCYRRKPAGRHDDARASGRAAGPPQVMRPVSRSKARISSSPRISISVPPSFRQESP